MDRLALPHHGIDMASEARREVRRTGGEEDKPEAGAGREVEGVPSRQHCVLGEEGAEVIS